MVCYGDKQRIIKVMEDDRRFPGIRGATYARIGRRPSGRRRWWCHAFGTHLLQAGHDTGTVRDLLGHTVATTMIYNTSSARQSLGRRSRAGKCLCSAGSLAVINSKVRGRRSFLGEGVVTDNRALHIRPALLHPDLRVGAASGVGLEFLLDSSRRADGPLRVVESTPG